MVPHQSLGRGCQKSIRCARPVSSKVNTAPTSGLETMFHVLLSGVVKKLEVWSGHRAAAGTPSGVPADSRWTHLHQTSSHVRVYLDSSLSILPSLSPHLFYSEPGLLRAWWWRGGFRVLLPAAFVLHPTPYIPHPNPYTPQPIPDALTHNRQKRCWRW